MGRKIPKPKFDRVKPINISQDKWPRGLNTLVSAEKIRPDELAVTDNIVLIDDGSPSRRPGQANYGDDSGSDGTYGLYAYYSAAGTRKVTKIEGGIFKEKSGATYSVVSGASFTSGLLTSHALTQDTLYLSNGTDPLTKYDGSILVRFSGISAPTTISAADGGSLPSGPYQYSYRVAAVNAVGETLAIAAATIAVDKDRDTWNPDPNSLNSNYSVLVTWDEVSEATGYNVYGVVYGDETYIGSTNSGSTTEWRDYGTQVPSTIFGVPVADTTTGPKGKFIIEYKSALLIAGDPNNPSRMYYSAGVDKPDDFSLAAGGGWVDVSKNSDDGEISGLGKYRDAAVIFKERSIWQFGFTESVLPSLQNVINGIGCVSHYSIADVENDLFFLGRKIGGGPAIYTLGNEPNYFNVLRTNELSARVRPDLQTLVPANYDKANATFFDGRYTLFYADGGATDNNAAIVYDRERLGFTKWMQIYSNFVCVFYDTDLSEVLLIADNNDGRVTEISDTYTDDKGTAISWRYRTRSESLDKPFLEKLFRWANVRFRSVGGTIILRVYTNNATNIFEKYLGVGSNSLTTSFRGLKFRVGKFRTTISGNSSSPADIIIRRIPVRRQGQQAIAKSMALEVAGENVDSRATMLDWEVEAMPKSKNLFSVTEIVD